MLVPNLAVIRKFHYIYNYIIIRYIKVCGVPAQVPRVEIV